MLIPVRCFSCNKVIGNKEKIFQTLCFKRKKTTKEALDILRLKRYCCRTVFLTYFSVNLKTDTDVCHKKIVSPSSELVPAV